MSATLDNLSITAERLRSEFDAAFARPARSGEAAGEMLVAVRVREDPFALRLDEIGGLFVDRAVTRLPGPFPELLGLTGFRGAVIPVYDLGALLGYPVAGSTRWLALSGGRAPVALAFDRFEGTVRVATDDLGNSGAAGNSGSTRHIRHVARSAEGPRPIVDIPSILTAIDRRIGEPG